MKIAIIPARGGSKRVPRKNIIEFGGKPMIVWSIEAAIRSNVFDHVIVSTDHDEIAMIAKSAGATVPFIRPSELANDTTATAPVVAHAIEEIAGLAIEPKYVCCIYATAPFIESEDIRKGFDILIETSADFVFTATSYPFPIQRSFRICDGARVYPLYPEHIESRSQDLAETFHDAGQFYWGTVDAWTEQRAIIGSNSVPLIIPRFRVEDIDTPEDLRRAERIFDANNMKP